MSDALKRLDKWHKTTEGHTVFGIVEIVTAYIAGSAALDNGSLLLWIVTIVLALGSVQNFAMAVHKRHK